VKPTFAVVIPTHNREDRLRRCLAGLIDQSRAPDEVIVVDDGSNVAVVDVIGDLSDRLPLKVLRQDTPTGPATARNLGWRSSSADFIAFTDDDCRPAPEWLASLAEHADAGAVLVGRTMPDPEDGPETSVLDRTIRIEECDGGFLTCNIVYPRAVLEALGGFDTTFRKPFGEDTDLGQRAMAGGARADYVESALVYHAVHRPNLSQTIQERRRLPELVRLAKMYPQLRRQLWSGAFISGYHERLFQALVGASLAPAVPVATALLGRPQANGERRSAVRMAALGVLLLPVTVAALAPGFRYLASTNDRVSRYPRNRRFDNIAKVVTLDFIEMAILASASVRERTFFL
jgi:glycosyltransferase involved in cell wall biosynthesis